MNEILINNQNVLVKEYEGKRVITFKDIDAVHNRPEGTSRRNFNTNKKHFIEGEDYFVRNSYEAKNEFEIIAPNGLVLISESGYLMLAKSLTDDLSWDVQRKLVKDYFTVKEVKSTFSELSPQLQLLINIETQQKRQQKEIDNVNTRLDNMVDVLSLDKDSWREDSKHLISKIAQQTGSGYDCMRDTYKEIYRLVEKRAGVALGTRLTNKRNRMAGEGVCKSKRDKLTKIDIIAEDKKLIEIYVAIVKEMAVKYGVC